MRLYELPLIRNLLLPIIVKLQGGDQRSKTIREYYLKKYRVDVGMYSYGGCFDPKFNLGGTVRIGKYCSIAQGVRYFGANHPTHKAVMSPFFYNKFFGFNVEDVPRGTLTIGNDVWVGYNVLITNRCHFIGNGAVIAAGAVVAEDVPAYSIVAGVPAKEIKKRFDKSLGDKLDKSQWFNKSPEELMKYYDSMNNPEEFVLRLIENK